jgi:AraC family L-rhamnose operon transcriptional activator RhaR
MVGYKDIKHFNEVFKKLTGMTPSVYKKLNGADVK